MSDIIEDSNDKQKKIEELNQEPVGLKKLLDTFPDLKKHTNRWGHVRYYSKTVNSKCDNYDLGHNCGCCSDSPLELRPYLKTEYGNVYSDPPCFTIGQRFDYSADEPYDNWDNELQESEIPGWIIEKIRAKFKEDAITIRNILDDYEEDDDYDEV